MFVQIILTTFVLSFGTVATAFTFEPAGGYSRGTETLLGVLVLLTLVCIPLGILGLIWS